MMCLWVTVKIPNVSLFSKFRLKYYIVFFFFVDSGVPLEGPVGFCILTSLARWLLGQNIMLSVEKKWL